jgi:plasmid stabilization system protein ParE
VNVRFGSDAQSELREAVKWLEDRSAGLGAGLVREVDQIIARISARPHHFPIVYKTVRRALLRRFPYGIYFTSNGDEIIVIACFHSSRDPGRWKARM